MKNSKVITFNILNLHSTFKFNYGLLFRIFRTSVKFYSWIIKLLSQQKSFQPPCCSRVAPNPKALASFATSKTPKVEKTSSQTPPPWSDPRVCLSRFLAKLHKLAPISAAQYLRSNATLSGGHFRDGRSFSAGAFLEPFAWFGPFNGEISFDGLIHFWAKKSFIFEGK